MLEAQVNGDRRTAIGQSVIDARVTLGMAPRSLRPPNAPGPNAPPTEAVRMSRVVVVKPQE